MEPEPIWEYFQHSLAVHHTVPADALLEDLEDKILFLQTGELIQVLVLGDFVKLLDGHTLQLGQMGAAPFDLLILGVHLRVDGSGRALALVLSRRGGARVLGLRVGSIQVSTGFVSLSCLCCRRLPFRVTHLVRGGFRHGKILLYSA
jgi:hypothetical protein